MSKQLDRIEAMLTELIGALPPRPCMESMPPHCHGDSAFDYRQLRADEAPFPTCYTHRDGVLVKLQPGGAQT